MGYDAGAERYAILCRGFDICELIAERPHDGLSRREISDRLGIHKRTAIRMLNALESAQLVDPTHPGTNAANRWRPGPRMRRMWRLPGPVSPAETGEVALGEGEGDE